MGAPIRLGLAGIGRAGWGMHVPELSARGGRFVFAAACDPLPERRQWMAERFGCRVYDTYEAMLADPEVEMVDIATPSILHARQALAALAAGKAVFAEKPFATTLADAEAVARAAEKRPGQFFVRHNARFDPLFNHVREIMATGLLGEIHSVRLRRSKYQRRNDWQTMKSRGGGQMLNTSPHFVDHLLLLLDAPVAEQWSRLARLVSAGDAEDHVRIVLRGENGRVADLEVSTGMALCDVPCRVDGTMGSLAADDKTITLKYLDRGRLPVAPALDPGTPLVSGVFGGSEDLPWIEKTVPVAPSNGARHEKIWDALYAAFREGEPYPIPTAHALEIMRVFERARQQSPAFADVAASDPES